MSDQTKRRFLFIPHDYRLPAVLGWLMLTGLFEPDEPVADTENGVLVPVRAKVLRS